MVQPIQENLTIDCQDFLDLSYIRLAETSFSIGFRVKGLMGERTASVLGGAALVGEILSHPSYPCFMRSLCDPYVSLHCNHQVKSTPVCWKTRQASWNSDHFFLCDRGARLIVSVGKQFALSSFMLKCHNQ